MPNLASDSICFEKYLELFAQEYPDDLHIIQLDSCGRRFHSGERSMPKMHPIDLTAEEFDPQNLTHWLLVLGFIGMAFMVSGLWAR